MRTSSGAMQNRRSSPQSIDARHHSHSIVNERSKLLIYRESQVAIQVFTVRLTVSSV